MTEDNDLTELAKKMCLAAHPTWGWTRLATSSQTEWIIAARIARDHFAAVEAERKS